MKVLFIGGSKSGETHTLPAGLAVFRPHYGKQSAEEIANRVASGEQSHEREVYWRKLGGTCEKEWAVFGGWSPSKAHAPDFDPSKKIEALIAMASVKIDYCKQEPANKRRSDFNKIKSSICRQEIGSPCFVCGNPGFDRHHIIQLQNGGINSRRNLVILCGKCHSKIHPWMKPRD